MGYNIIVGKALPFPLLVDSVGIAFCPSIEPKPTRVCVLTYPFFITILKNILQ